CRRAGAPRRPRRTRGGLARHLLLAALSGFRWGRAARLRGIAVPRIVRRRGRGLARDGRDADQEEDRGEIGTNLHERGRSSLPETRRVKCAHARRSAPDGAPKPNARPVSALSSQSRSAAIGWDGTDDGTPRTLTWIAWAQVPGCTIAPRGARASTIAHEQPKSTRPHLSVAATGMWALLAVRHIVEVLHRARPPHVRNAPCAGRARRTRPSSSPPGEAQEDHGDRCLVAVGRHRTHLERRSPSPFCIWAKIGRASCRASEEVRVAA